MIRKLNIEEELIAHNLAIHNFNRKQRKAQEMKLWGKERTAAQTEWLNEDIALLERQEKEAYGTAIVEKETLTYYMPMAIVSEENSQCIIHLKKEETGFDYLDKYFLTKRESLNQERKLILN